MAFGGDTVVGRATVVLDADTKQFSSGMNSAQASLNGMGRKTSQTMSGVEKSTKKGATAFSSLGKTVGALGIAFGAMEGVKAATKFLGDSVNAAREAETVNKALATQMKALGLSYKDHSKQIDNVITKQSKLSALDDEELTQSFTNLVRTTGNVNEALKANALAADVARAKNLGIEQASKLVQRAMMGSVGALKRYGVDVKAVTTAQDRLRDSGKSYTRAQMEAAKETDKQATAQKAMAALQKTFAGQAEAYGKTSQGAAERMGVAWENFQESIGKALLPTLTRLANWFTDLIPKIQSFGSSLVQNLGPAFETVKGIISAFLGPAKAVFDAIREAFGGGAGASAKSWGDTVASALNIVVKAINFILAPTKFWLGLMARLYSVVIPAAISAIRALIGGIKSMVEWFKNLPERARNMVNSVREAFTRMANWVKEKAGNIVEFVKGIPGKIGDIGSKIWAKLKGGWNDVWSWVKGKGQDLVDWFKKIPSRLGDFAGGLVSAITGPFKEAWNAVARAINSIPDIKIPGWVPVFGGKSFGFPTMPTLASGGRVGGSGSADSILALLTPGEAVLNADQIKRLGGPAALRAAGVPGFQKGGKVLPGTSHDYPRGKRLNDHQIADLVYRTGWENKERQKVATAVVLGESSGNWSAHYTGGGNEDSWGGWQINRKAHSQVTVKQAKDPEWSSGYARRLYNQAGWQPWGAYTDGRYKSEGRLERARKAVEWHRQALKNANKPKDSQQPKSGGGGKDNKPAGNVPPSVGALPGTGGTISDAIILPGANYRSVAGTWYQDERNRYVNFQPDAAWYWRPGLNTYGPLLGVPTTLDDSPGTELGVYGSAAVGHPFSFPKWNKWFGLGTYGAFTDMAKFKSWSPKKLREWIGSNELEAQMIGYTTENIPEVDAWAAGKGSNSSGGKGDKAGKGGKADQDPKGGRKPTRQEKVNARRWKEVQAAIKEVTRIDRLGLSYVLGGNHTGSMPGGSGPYDCSSFASRILMASGIIPGRASYVSDNFLPGGSAGMVGGAGKWITTWAHRGTGRYGHVFLGLPGGRHAESGGSGGGNWTHRSTSGFVASHPKGYAQGGVVGPRPHHPSGRGPWAAGNYVGSGLIRKGGRFQLYDLRHGGADDYLPVPIQRSNNAFWNKHEGDGVSHSAMFAIREFWAKWGPTIVKRSQQGLATGGWVPGPGGQDTIPALLTPGEVVLNRSQQGRLQAMTGHGRDLWDRIGVPNASGSGTLKAHEGTQTHFHWYGEQNRWIKGEKGKFLDMAKTKGEDGKKIVKNNPWMDAVFAGTATPGSPKTVHGPKQAPPATPQPDTPGGGAPGENWEDPALEEDTGGGDGGDTGGGDGGPSGPTAAEIEAQIQERLRKEAEAIWSARSGFMSELAPNIFTKTPAGLELGSAPLVSPGQQPIIINSNFSQVPEDPFVWLRHVGTAAKYALT